MVYLVCTGSTLGPLMHRSGRPLMPMLQPSYSLRWLSTIPYIFFKVRDDEEFTQCLVARLVHNTYTIFTILFITILFIRKFSRILQTFMKMQSINSISRNYQKQSYKLCENRIVKSSWWQPYEILVLWTKEHIW